jgi:hypothetical protein
MVGAEKAHSAQLRFNGGHFGRRFLLADNIPDRNENKSAQLISAMMVIIRNVD